MDPFSAAIAIVVAVAYLGAIVFAITQIMRSAELEELERWVWVAAVVFFPFVAAIVWFAAGPHPFGIRLTHGIR